MTVAGEQTEVGPAAEIEIDGPGVTVTMMILDAVLPQGLVTMQS